MKITIRHTAINSALLLTITMGAPGCTQAKQQDKMMHTDHTENHHHQHKAGKFADAEHWAERFNAPDRHKTQKPQEVIMHMGIRPGMTVVDIGAGTGYFLPYLSKAVGPQGHVLALDIEQSLVNYMNNYAAKHKLKNVSPKLCAPDEPGLKPNSVDRILMVNTWHHIAKQKDYAEKLKLALKPNGQLYIVEVNQNSTHGPPISERIPPKTLRSQFISYGYQAQILEETLPEQYMLRIAANM